MANGFKALRHVGGGVQRYSEYGITAASAPAIFNGDMVILTSGKILKAATNEAHLGAFVGCMYKNAKGEQIFSPNWPADTAATNVKGLICEDPEVTYAVTSGVTLTVGALCDLVPGSGTASTGASTGSVTTSTNGDFVVKSILDATNKLYEVKIV